MDNHEEEKEPLIAQSRGAEGGTNLSGGLEGDFHDAWLEGVAHGYAKAMDECIKSAKRDGGTVGGRNCMEVREAINKLHFETLCERYPVLRVKPSNVV